MTMLQVKLFETRGGNVRDELASARVESLICAYENTPLSNLPYALVALGSKCIRRGLSQLVTQISLGSYSDGFPHPTKTLHKP